MPGFAAFSLVPSAKEEILYPLSAKQSGRRETYTKFIYLDMEVALRMFTKYFILQVVEESVIRL